MWVNIINGGGRVNLAQVTQLVTAPTGGTWAVLAYLVTGQTPYLATGLASQADAEAFIADLLVDGS